MSENKNGYAQVKGVLKYNDETRKQMLRRNYWKDMEYIKYADGICKYRDIETREVSPVTGGMGLYAYTQDKNNKYGYEINSKYMPNVDKSNYESVPYENDIHKWDGNYLDIFSDNNKLGEVGDAEYLRLMTFGLYANADRFLEDKYLTPSLVGVYGTNPQIEGNNGYFNVFNRVGGVYKHESGRIVDIPEADVKIVHDYDYSRDSENNGGTYYLEQNLKNASLVQDIKYRLGLQKYVEYSRKENEPRGVIEDIENEDGFNTNLHTMVLKGLNRYDNIDEDGIQFYENGIEDYSNGSEIIWSEQDIPRDVTYKGKDLLRKTSALFRSHKINTMVSRFYDADFVEGKFNPYDTAISKTYGHSHGRNLLKLDASISDTMDISGYDNPFCRTWTNRHQYSRLSDMIRPFSDSSNIEDVQSMNKAFRAASGQTLENGGKYLTNNTVLNNNGFVNIAPTKEINGRKNEVKKCMFSLENLAWKDVVKKNEYISPEQTGPNGGRIMWFPPYDLDFQESVTVDWDQNSIIGRGEKVYTYKNTDRTGTLSFSLLIDHPNIINTLQGKQGMGEEKDLEADVLRFFAGCRIFDLSEEKRVIADETQNMQTDEPAIESSPEKAKHIKFNVYFPNNYSGNLTPVSKEMWRKIGYSNRDWFYYLLLGNGIGVNITDTDDWNGYEMCSEGLGESEQTINANPTVTGCTQWIDRKEDGGKKYHYRTDFDLKQILYNDDNYVDRKSFKLNSQLEGNESYLNGCNYTFAEVMIAILTSNKESFGITSNMFLEDIKNYAINICGARRDAIEELIADFSSDLFTPLEASVCGSATKQDSKKRGNCEQTNSDMLAERRCKAISTMLDEYLFKNHEVKCTILPNIEQDLLNNMATVNSKEAKGQRFAIVELSYNAPTINKKSESDIQEYANVETESGGTYILGNDEENISFVENREEEIEKEEVFGEDKEEYEKVAAYQSSVNNDSCVRYETESEYFENLNINSPMVFNNLVEKFKYFSPAFHSISPEGFNARLNFLHQCTRQGHTIEASDRNGYAQTAGNLSFGRMPICVLRIGDFINTRILINSMSINYGENGGIQWDLNPEGAGVQPMFAKISLGIVILGGQSLEGPINRLQNAVSFDYYANTGVYDNRADRVTITNGETVYKHLWTPLPEKNNEKTD